jgi:hypothetical protein
VGSVSEGPYSRVYWTVLDDKKFDPIRADMRLFGSWALMLVIADMAYPAPAFVPPTVSRASLKALVDVKLVEILPAHMYRIVGLKKEREQRSERGRKGADARWSGNADAMHPQSVSSNATGLLDETSTRRDEQRLDENEQPARDGLPNLNRDAIRLLEDRTGRPWSLAGDKQLGEYDRLVGDHGLAAVGGAFDAVAQGKTLTARQLIWPAMKLLEPMPSQPDRVPAQEVESDDRSKRVYARMVERRLEWFHSTGKWDEAWGPQPESVA